MSSSTRRGRPPYAWLDAAGLASLPLGTAASVETHGRHGSRLIGRITAASDRTVELATPRGPVAVATTAIKRGRVVDALYEPGDPVLRRGVPAGTWRGGVVHTNGTDVLVEQTDGTFAWLPEADLEPADARDPGLPALPRGPVPARA